MKNKKTIFPLLLLILFFLPFGMAQDRIYFNDGTEEEVRIETIVRKKIAYVQVVNGEEVWQTVPIRKVQSVVWADGTKIIYRGAISSDEYIYPAVSGDYTDPKWYEKQKKRGLKIHLLSPMLGHTSLSYEQNVRPGKGLEFTLGMIGLGNNLEVGNVRNAEGVRVEVNEDQKGIHLGFGYKIYSKPAIRSTGHRYKHLLEGWYVMPKVLVGYYHRNAVNYRNFSGDEIEREKIGFGHLMVYGGKQIVFSGSVLLDWQIGAGLGYDTDSHSSGFHYSVSDMNAIAIGGGVRLGFVF